jgi:hypothetical protein
MSTRLDSLEAIDAAIWRELSAAARDRQHPWRTPVMATTDGQIGDARTVVLRDVDPVQRTFFVYTDARAGKVSQLAQHPLGTLVMWSEALGWQLRVRVHVDVSIDGLEVSSRWARLKLTPAAHDYLSALAPGSPLETALGARGERVHFALLEAHVLSIDWLELHALGHRRARFDSDCAARWLQP